MDGSSGFNDIKLLEAVELTESQKMSEKPADETDTLIDIPEFVKKPEGYDAKPR